MVDVDQITAYGHSQRDREWSSRCLLASFAYLGVPDSLLDVGCGDGHLVRLASKLNVTAMGIDLNVGTSYGEGWNTRRVDLAVGTFRCFKPYDIVICWELAEHLPESRADALCSMLARSTGGHLLFSAAIPGQGGSGHLNEQPHRYWRGKLYDAGLAVSANLTARLRNVFTEVAPTTWWYGQNLQVLRKQ